MEDGEEQIRKLQMLSIQQILLSSRAFKIVGLCGTNAKSKEMQTTAREECKKRSNQ